MSLKIFLAYLISQKFPRGQIWLHIFLPFMRSLGSIRTIFILKVMKSFVKVAVK